MTRINVRSGERRKKNTNTTRIEPQIHVFEMNKIFTIHSSDDITPDAIWLMKMNKTWPRSSGAVLFVFFLCGCCCCCCSFLFVHYSRCDLARFHGFSCGVLISFSAAIDISMFGLLICFYFSSLWCCVPMYYYHYSVYCFGLFQFSDCSFAVLELCERIHIRGMYEHRNSHKNDLAVFVVVVASNTKTNLTNCTTVCLIPITLCACARARVCICVCFAFVSFDCLFCLAARALRVYTTCTLRSHSDSTAHQNNKKKNDQPPNRLLWSFVFAFSVLFFSRMNFDCVCWNAIVFVRITFNKCHWNVSL